MRNVFESVAFAASLLSLVRAQNVQKGLWNIPDGSKPNDFLVFEQGVTVPLSWNGWPAPAVIDGHEVLADLWVLPADNTITDAYHLVRGKTSFHCPSRHSLIDISSESVNITNVGMFNWRVNISDSEISRSGGASLSGTGSGSWRLSFKKHTNPARFDASTPELSSPNFILIRSIDMSPSRSSSSSMPTSSSVTTASAINSITPLPTGPSKQTGLPSNYRSSGQLGTGVQAALGAGIGVGAVGVIGAALFFFMRRRRAKANAVPPKYEAGDIGAYMGHQGPYDPMKDQEPHLNHEIPSELGDTEAAVRYPVELPTTRH